MGRLAKRNLTRSLESQTSHRFASPVKQPRAYTQANLTRAVSQHIPFRDESFHTVVATFPTEYIFQPETLDEAHRVLTAGGRLVILPGATILGRGVIDRIMALLFHITGQAAPNLSEVLRDRSKDAFANADFHVQIHELDIKSSLVFIIVATKSSSLRKDTETT